jgi:hypothetical protein
MAKWRAIEVFHAAFSAARWKDSYSSWLIESAISNNAVNWAWQKPRRVVSEVAFARAVARNGMWVGDGAWRLATNQGSIAV